ncbi:MAG: hypothetical protein M1294_08050 [Firmicutes bacterium]|jgi:hydrogenase-4 membrane subunit HyfE|uniref:Uncharacterized protein n=1 Tax=Sulfobacillus benefaciens TaxID=453960 RepID=A0A2T2X869_9FIRM|nr:hypothetical protein [Bacillota bacterium]MCL5012575.1 hypothetical protein [Bacillota bacterium]PSR30704.1 MAG: hypothetical protein C7B43_05280 [Sulfobacillus benefaciens]
MSETLVLRVTVSAMWVFTVIMILVKNNRSARILYRLNALTQAVLLAFLALFLNQNGLWVSAGLVLTVKAFGVPRVMRSGSYVVERDYSAHSPVGMAFALIITVAVTIFGFLVGQQLHGYQPVVQSILWGTWLVALFQMILRYEIWSEAWGLLNFEIVTSSLAVLLITTFPLVPDILVDAVAIGMALLLTAYMALMRSQYDSVDVRKAGELKG